MFNILAKVKVRQSIMGALISVVSSPFGAIGLILGQIANQSSGVLTLLRYSSISLWPVRSYDFYSILTCMKKYKNFAKYTCPAGLVNVLGNQLPYIILLSYYGPSQLGQLALADKILLLPAGLLGNSVGQVFLNEAANSYRDGNLQKLLLRTSKKLAFLAIGSAVIVVLFVCPFVPLIFGQRWTESRDLILLAIPLFCGKLIVSPISMCFLIAERNKQELAGQLTLLLLRSVPLLLMAYLGYSFHFAFFAYSVFSMLGYLAYGILAYFSSKNITKDCLIHVG
jgi:O-antigen/teichoic acid export membrane protein